MSHAVAYCINYYVCQSAIFECRKIFPVLLQGLPLLLAWINKHKGIKESIDGCNWKSIKRTNRGFNLCASLIISSHSLVHTRIQIHTQKVSYCRNTDTIYHISTNNAGFESDHSRAQSSELGIMPLRSSSEINITVLWRVSLIHRVHLLLRSLKQREISLNII